MHKIVKSSNVSIGNKKEIGSFYLTNNIQTEESNDNLDKRIKEFEDSIKLKIEDANRQAQMIISEAYEDSKIIFNNAKTEGYKTGYTEGFDEVKKETDSIIKEALAIKQELQSAKEKLAKELEEQIVSLVIDSVEKILFTKLDKDKDTILGLVKHALEKCTYTESLILRISPEDYDYVLGEKDKILCLAENISDIAVKKDGSLKRGSCILDTLSGSIDSSVATQLEQLSKTFKELLEGE